MTLEDVRGRDAALQRRGHRRRLRASSACRASCRSTRTGCGAVSPDLSCNTAVSFATNTNWQSYGGETTMSYFTQMLALAVQNFVSRGVGHGGAGRAHPRHRAQDDVDARQLLGRSRRAARSTSCCRSRSSSRSSSSRRASCRRSARTQHGRAAAGDQGRRRQRRRPSRCSRSARPRRRSRSSSSARTAAASSTSTRRTRSRTRRRSRNFLEMLALLADPRGAHATRSARWSRTRGRAGRCSRRCSSIFLPLLCLCVAQEQAGNPALASLARRPGGERAAGRRQHGGQGGALRHLGDRRSARPRRPAASCGAVNAMHDSFTPLGGLVPLWLIQLGEVIFGGVGSGLYGMLDVRRRRRLRRRADGRAHARVPRQEDRGQRDEDGVARHPHPARRRVLVFTAIAVVDRGGQEGRLQPRAARLQRDPLRVLVGGEQQRQRLRRPHARTRPSTTRPSASRCSSGASSSRSRCSRSRARSRRRRSCPPSAGTLPTHTPLFVAMLVGVIIIVGALTFIPALALGPDRRAAARARREVHAMSTNKLVDNPRPLTRSAATPPRLAAPPGHVDTHRPRQARPLFEPAIVTPRDRRLVPQARPAPPGAKPGHVRRRGRQRPHDGARSSRRSSGTARRRPGSSSPSRSGSGSPCSSRTSPRRWPRGAARRRPTRCARRARTSRPSSSREPQRDARARAAVSASQLRKGDVVLVEAGDVIPVRRRDRRGRRLGRRERHHRRERAGHPRERRRPQRGHRRHARALRLARRAHHGRTRARRSSTG